METLRCINREKDKFGNITEYLLIDSFGTTHRYKPLHLKELMRTNKVNVKNLKLTENNRLIEKKEKETYYRYVYINDANGEMLGGLYRGVNRVLNLLDEYGAYDDYDDVNLCISNLEYSLNCPKIKSTDNFTFYYTEFGNSDSKLQECIEELRDLLYDWDIIIKCEEITDYQRCIYRDDEQVALVV